MVLGTIPERWDENAGLDPALVMLSGRTKGLEAQQVLIRGPVDAVERAPDGVLDLDISAVIDKKHVGAQANLAGGRAFFARWSAHRDVGALDALTKGLGELLGGSSRHES